MSQTTCVFDYIERIYIYIHIFACLVPYRPKAMSSHALHFSSNGQLRQGVVLQEVSDGDPQTWGKEILLKHVETKFQKLAIWEWPFLDVETIYCKTYIK